MSDEMTADMSDLETKINELSIADEKSDYNEPVFSLDEEDKNKVITLTTMCGYKLTITKQNATISQMLSQIIETDPTAEEIPLPQVTQRILSLIIEYANHHGGIPQEILEMPIMHVEMSKNCKHKWDAEFIDRIGDNSRRTLYDLIEAANYMDIKCLLHLACAKMASWLKGVSLETIEKRLFTDDVDPEKVEFKSRSSGLGVSGSSDGTNSSSDTKNNSVETKVLSVSVEPDITTKVDVETDASETALQTPTDVTEAMVSDPQPTPETDGESDTDSQVANEESDPLTIHS